MSKHTPTPWEIQDPMCDDLWLVETGKETYEWRCIASVQATPADEGSPLSRAEMWANAAFIVKAVNSHDALVKALERIARGPFTGASTIARDVLRDFVGTGSKT